MSRHDPGNVAALNRIAELRKLRRRLDDELDKLTARVSATGLEVKRPTRLQAIDPEVRDQYVELMHTAPLLDRNLANGRYQPGTSRAQRVAALLADLAVPL